MALLSLKNSANDRIKRKARPPKAEPIHGQQRFRRCPIKEHVFSAQMKGHNMSPDAQGILSKSQN
jgi:hypothetical protein